MSVDKEMRAVMYLDTYLDSLDSLPTDLQRSFLLMRDLDTKVQTILKDIDKESHVYMENTAKLTPSKRREATDKIGKMYSKAKELADDKVQLAMSTYESVDKHIRKLDTELARFENELKEKLLSKTGQSNPKMLHKQRKRERGSKKDAPKQKRKSKLAHEIIEADPMLLPSLQSITNGGEVMDMPVDPNEPTYCLCHQVSYGEMIGCDNTECPIEWFHFACVGLSTQPKGKWYCPKCGPPPVPEKKKKSVGAS